MISKRTSYRADDNRMYPLRSWHLIALAILVVLTPRSKAHAELRTWKSSNGKFSVQAELTQTSSRDITLRRSDGTSIHVALNALSSDDKQFVSEYREANSEPVLARDEFGEPIDLLPLIDVGDASKGTWARDGDALVTGKEYRTQMAVPYSMPLEYEIRMTIQLHQGNDSLNLGLPMGDRTALVLIDAFDGQLTGINFVAKKPIRQNVTTYRKRLLNDNQPHDLVCTVHRRHMRLTFDGNTVFEWVGRPNQLARAVQHWTNEDFPANQIVMATWKTAWRIDRLEVVPIVSSRWNDLSLASTSDSIRKSIALIETETGSGSGFIAGHNLVATNHHVVADATFDEIKVYFGDDVQPMSVKRILASSEQDDLAILEVETKNNPLPMAWDGVFPKGEVVHIHGNPSIENNVLLRGATVAGTIQSRFRMEGQDYMQIAANVNPGSSGGPVLNQSGQVVGVVVMKATDEGETFLRDASRRFDAGVQSNQTVGHHGVALAIPGPVLIRTLKEVGELRSQRASETTAQHDAVAVISRALKVAGYDYLRLIGNTPQRVLAQARQSRAQTTLEMPPEDVRARIRGFTHSASFTGHLASLRKALYERMQRLSSEPFLDDDAKKGLRDLRAELSRLEKFADQPSATYARFERTVLGIGENLEQLSKNLRKNL